MMADVPTLRSFRENFLDARFSGVRAVRDRDGSEVTYRSDAELARAIAAVDLEIAALTARRSTLIRFQTSKGV